MLDRTLWIVGLLLAVGNCPLSMADGTAGEPLPGTEPLVLEGDVASDMVAGVDRFLLRKLEQSIAARGRYWQLDKSSRTPTARR